MCIGCILTALKTVESTLKVPIYIKTVERTLKVPHLKTTPAQPSLRKHEIMIDTIFLIRHFCTFLLRLNFLGSDGKHLQLPIEKIIKLK